MEPTPATVKRLFALSGNRCAFQNCQAPIVEDSGSVTGVICHIMARSQGGPRYDANQTERQRHSFDNLILMCARHSKLIDSEPDRLAAAKLRKWKANHERYHLRKPSPSDAEVAKLLLNEYRALSISSAGGHVMVNSPGAVQASTVVFKSQKKSGRRVPPAGSIGSDLSKVNYIKHLIDRYHEFASQQRDRSFRYQAVYGAITRKFGAKWDLVPLEQFRDIALFLQRKIDGTIVGRRNRGNGYPNYSGYSQYQEKYETPRQSNAT